VSHPAPSHRWVEPPPAPPERVSELTDRLGLPTSLSRLLVHRGRSDPDEVRRFLRPDLSRLHPPGLLPDASRAVERIERARDDAETVLVHGDFDADGMCAAALLTRGLRECGVRAHGFVPHRLRDGYDFGPAGLERAEEVGATLVVTADCGISSVGAVAEARRAGRDVVVTDHHRPPEVLPEAVALVNPAREGGEYPFDGLSGTGVAFKLLELLFGRAGRPRAALQRHLDLVALGSVADLVPLVDENRVLVRAGLRALERSRKPGIRALLRAGGLADVRLGSGDLGYRLAPRLNAAGRVGEASDGLRLLLTDDAREAADLAADLERHNRERRRADRAVHAEAHELLEREFEPGRHGAAVLWAEGWHPGVIGIAASRLAEEIHRPVALVSLAGETGRGSARSVDGFHLHSALESCAPLLERYGGHRLAAGFEVRRDRLPELRERLGELAREALAESERVPELRIDLRIPLRAADRELLGWLRHLEPFGPGNPEPVLAAGALRLEGARRVGDGGAHLKVRLRGPGGSSLDAIGFGMGERLGELGSACAWEAAFELAEDEYRGRRRLQARLRDLRPDGSGGKGSVRDGAGTACP